MNRKNSRRLFWGSALVALLLQLIELPHWLALFRPQIVPMVMAYWALVTPQQATGLFGAWLLGLVLDVLLGTAFGQHALGLVLVVFAVKQARNFLVLFPMWQVGVALLPLWLLYVFLMFWIDGATQHQADPWLRWLPVITSAAFWPAVASVLGGLRRREREDQAAL
ncbi:MAG: rod shape-determining protein MreD [Gammaproteobacteria bacterium]|nr:rod shape-determining protein MreD [Gammaproteobacteria bacterium]